MRAFHGQAPRHGQQVAQSLAIDAREPHQHDRNAAVMVGNVVGLGEPTAARRDAAALMVAASRTDATRPRSFSQCAVFPSIWKERRDWDVSTSFEGFSTRTASWSRPPRAPRTFALKGRSTPRGARHP